MEFWVFWSISVWFSLFNIFGKCCFFWSCRRFFSRILFFRSSFRSFFSRSFSFSVICMYFFSRSNNCFWYFFSFITWSSVVYCIFFVFSFIVVGFFASCCFVSDDVVVVLVLVSFLRWGIFWNGLAMIFLDSSRGSRKFCVCCSLVGVIFPIKQIFLMIHHWILRIHHYIPAPTECFPKSL